MPARHVVLVSPFAALASACVEPALTPVDVGTPLAGPSLQDVALPSRVDAIVHWQLRPDNPWASYAKYTLFSALDDRPREGELPDIQSLDEVQRATIAGERVGSGALPPGTLWVVDLHGAASVAFGVAISQSADVPVSLVPTFNNWPAEGEMVPAEDTLAAIATMAPKPLEGDATATRAVFLLDSWRLAYRDEEADDETYDNRYMLTASDLPDAATLRQQGIDRVVYVIDTRDGGSVEEDDLHATFLDWQAAGISIAMSDLDTLEGPLEYPSFFYQQSYAVVPRVTVIEEPWFYHRHRGAFGGIHARPSPIRLMHGYWAPYGVGG